jgi:hydrogenase-4 component F
MPPMGMFMSEFLLVSSTIARQPLLAIPLVGGLLLAFGALLTQGMRMAFGEGQRGTTVPPTMLYVPEFAHFALVLVAGVYIPPPVVAWFQHVATLLG